MEEVKDINTESKSTDELIRQMKDSGGFTAKKLGETADILEEMFTTDCRVFLSFPACIVATGTRGVIADMLRKKRVGAVITTCGTLDHDLARLWKRYYHGTFMADDAELHKRGINRLGNVFVPNESYGIILESKIQPMLKKIYEKKKEWSTHELVWEFGRMIENEPRHEESIVYWAYKNRIPVFLPGPLDGSWGFQLWMFWQEHKDFKLNLFEDEHALFDSVHEAKKTGALLIGGGISKHHVIWWNQFRGGLDYAVAITTAPEWDGSLSGAQMREAVSWGKVKEKARYVTVEGDATVLLPLLISAVEQRLKK